MLDDLCSATRCREKLGNGMQKNFKDLSEREILALAISLEEEDPFLMKNVVLLAASFYLLKQDVVRASLSAGRVAPDRLERVGRQRERGAA